MTTKEFSQQFDLLYNNISSNQAPGLDEFEKSVFLTNAQNQLILTLYNGKNANGDSFESSEELRRYLDALVKHKDVDSITKTSSFAISDYSYRVTLEDDVWFIIYESVDWELDSCLPKTNVQVLPVTHDEYHRIKNNPFRGANNTRVLRIDSVDSVELISKYPISKYTYRYMSKPSPIILDDLGDDKIGGISVITECILPEPLHLPILQLAVQSAWASWKSN